MKRLILVRHGKSSWEYDLPDEERPLKKRAYKDAALVSEALRKQMSFEGAVWSSNAKRALTTARLFQESLGVAESRFEVRPELYTFSAEVLRRIILNSGEKQDVLMIFGHNPALTDLANNLGDQFFDNIPTTGLVVLDFQDAASWQDIETARTFLYLFPKNLR